MNLDPGLVDSTLRLTVLQAAEPAAEARVENVAGRRILVTCGCPLKIGAAVQLDAPDRMLLAEVLSLERMTTGNRALLDIRHSVLHADLEHIRLQLKAPDFRTSAAGV